MDRRGCSQTGQGSHTRQRTAGVFCNVMMCVNHQGYVSILLSARLAVNQGGTADMFIRPWQIFFEFLSGIFILRKSIPKTLGQ